MSEKQFYSAEDAGPRIGISAHYFRKLAHQAAVKPKIFEQKSSIGVRRVHRYTLAQIEQIRQYHEQRGWDVESVVTAEDSITLRIPLMPDATPRNARGFVRLCLHCPHATKGNLHRCCQCGEPVEVNERGVYASTLAIRA